MSALPADVEAALAAFWGRYDAALEAAFICPENNWDNGRADLLATVTALVDAERERYAEYMDHTGLCELFDHAQGPQSTCTCGLEAIRQAPRP